MVVELHNCSNVRELTGGRRSRMLVATVLTALASVLGACGVTASPAAAAADANFLASVHDNAPDIGSYRSDVALVRLGHAACDDFRGGVSYQQLADRLVLAQGSNGVPAADLGAVITAAVSAFCPQYQALVH